jgi:DNA gyrase/topoisomerase IV subunit A
LRLQQLTALEADTLRSEHADKTERIRELRELLGNEDMVFDLIKTELNEISDRYGDERRTEIAPSEDDLDIEDLIQDQQWSSRSRTPAISRCRWRPTASAAAASGSWDGPQGRRLHRHLFVSSTHDFLCATNRGKVYRSKSTTCRRQGALQGSLPRHVATTRATGVVRARDARLPGDPVPDVRDRRGTVKTEFGPTTPGSRPTASSPSRP